MPSFHCITFGCQMNVNDSAWIARSLVNMGWQETDMEHADFVFLNTCSVREKPQHKVLSTLGMIRDINPQASVGVAGCVAQQMGEKLWEKNAHVRLVLGSDGIIHAPEAFLRIAKHKRLRLSYLDFTETFPDRKSVLLPFKEVDYLPTGTSSQKKSQKSNDTRAFINIMQGCDNFCAYCIVPYTRGPRKSRPVNSILDECKEWLDRGISDITLLGQNVNVFGNDKGKEQECSFHELLYKVANLDGIKRLHMVTPHPRDFSDATIKAYQDLPQLAPRLHLPIQAGSDTVLKAMGRGYTNSDFLKLVEKLKIARPELALSSDIIVGFPGETEEDFQETLRIVKEVNFIASFSFAYSDRPGTRASKMENKIPTKIQSERLNRLMEQQSAQEEAWLKSLEGKETDVLLESHSSKPQYSHITQSPKDKPASLIKEENANLNNISNIQGSSENCETKNYEGDYTSWQGHDSWGNTVNVLIPNALGHKAGDIVTTSIVRAKKHSLLAEIKK